MYCPSRPFDFNPLRECCDVNTTENELRVSVLSRQQYCHTPLALFISHPHPSSRLIYI